MGEVARAYLLARWGQIPYGATVASLVVERVLDGLSLALLLLVALWLVPSAPGYLLAVGVIAGCGFFAGLALLALAAWRGSASDHLRGLLRPMDAAQPGAEARRAPPVTSRARWRSSTTPLGWHACSVSRWWPGAASWGSSSC